MPTTPNRGWIYPSLEQNPYFETIEDFFLAQDTDMHATMTGVRTVATGGTGATTLASGAYLRGAGTGAVTTQAIPIPVGHGGTGAATFTASQILYGAGTSPLTSNPYLIWDAANSMLLVEKDGLPPYIQLVVHTSDLAQTYPSISMRSSRGTKASPTTTLINDGLFYIHGGGQISPSATYGTSAEIYAFATENWTTTAGGSTINISTTQNGTTAPVIRMQIGHDGAITFSQLSGVGTRYATIGSAGNLAAQATPIPTHLARITDGATVANTTTETLLQAFTIPAGVMSVAGATLRVYASGTTAMAAACTLTLRIKIVSPVLMGLSDAVLSVGVTAGTQWVATGGAITRTAGSSGVLIGETGLFGVVFSGLTPGFRYGATSMDLTGALQGQVTAQMSVANAGNTVTLTTCTVEIDYATATF